MGLKGRIGDPDGSQIQNWLRNRNTIEFLDIWEQLNNPDLIPSNSMGLENHPA